MKTLSPKEKILFYLLVLILAASLIGWGTTFYLSKTQAIPDYGGEYIEGMVGQPMNVNPVLSRSNDVDGDISQIIYSGLMKYDSQGKLTEDLAESYELSEDKTTYTIRLKSGVKWHDGEPVSADDVLFTANIIGNPSYKSPLRPNLQGVETDKVDDQTVTFKIKTPYVGFLNNLTFGILPKHIWESIETDKFPLAATNLEPIGSGPYKFESIQQDSKKNILSYKLAANPNYFEGKPYISKITFNFYADENSMIEAYNKKEVMGIAGLSPNKASSLKLQGSTLLHRLDLPRYFAVFFNQQKSLSLADDKVREALSHATDRQEIIEKVLDKNGKPVYSPMLPGMLGYTEDLEKREFDLEKANKLLDDAGWKRQDDGTRAKDGNRLEMNLVTTDWEQLVKTAQILKDQWEKAGARINISNYSISDIQQNYIRPREYEALLYGQVLGSDPDPFYFWHSTQKKDPGLNLSLYGDDATDKLIDEGRNKFDEEKRAKIYEDFQKKLLDEAPAVFLYSPDYVYPVNKKVRGIDIQNLVLPSKRFSDINHWHISTKRIWK